jgi:hypothetical protein
MSHQRAPVALGDRVHRASRDDLAAPLGDVLSVGGGHLREVDDAGVGRVQGGDADGVWLELANLLRADSTQSRHSVLDPAALELVQAVELSLGGGDDELARALGADPPRLAVLVELGGALHAESCLHRSWAVVDPRVDHAA